MRCHKWTPAEVKGFLIFFKAITKALNVVNEKQIGSDGFDNV